MSFDNSKVIATKGYLIGSADAIRRKLGTSDTITLPNFESAIDSIPSGGGEPYIPKTREIVNYDFSQAEYDLARSLNVDSSEPRNKALLYIYKYNATYDSTNGVVKWTNGYGHIRPKFYINPYMDYTIEIDFGNVSNDYSGGSNRQLFAIGDSMKVYWNTSGYIRRENSSGGENWTALNSLSDYVSNKKVTITCTWSHNNVNEPVNYWYISFEGDNESPRFLGNWDTSQEVNIYIGRRTSQDGLYPMEVKSVKVTETRWELGEQPDDIIQPLNITENGTYTANGTTIVGYSPVTVNVPTRKVLISEFDFTDFYAWKTDTVKNIDLPVSSYTGVSRTDEVGMYITGTGGSFDTQNRLNRYGVYEIDMEFGTNETSTYNSYNTIFNFLRSGSHFNVRWNNSQNKWMVSDATGANKWIESSDPHFFDGKKVKVTYGCRYVDGVLTVDGYRNTMSIYTINNDDTLTELCYSNENYDEVFLKLGGGNSYVGFVYKNIKVYQHFDKYYPQQVSLLTSQTPSEETRAVEEEEQTDER